MKDTSDNFSQAAIGQRREGEVIDHLWRAMAHPIALRLGIGISMMIAIAAGSLCFSLWRANQFRTTTNPAAIGHACLIVLACSLPFLLCGSAATVAVWRDARSFLERSRRVRRACVDCGYPEGVDRCPECGRGFATPRRKAMPGFRIGALALIVYLSTVCGIGTVGNLYAASHDSATASAAWRYFAATGAIAPFHEPRWWPHSGTAVLVFPDGQIEIVD